MNTLETLIKLTDNKLNEQRKIIVEIRKQIDNFLEAIKKLNTDLEFERETAKIKIEVAHAFANYAIENLRRQQMYYEEIDRLKVRESHVQAYVLEIFEELKKYEIANDNKLRLQKEEALKEEAKVLNEFGIKAHYLNNQG